MDKVKVAKALVGLAKEITAKSVVAEDPDKVITRLAWEAARKQIEEIRKMLGGPNARRLPEIAPDETGLYDVLRE